VGGGVLPSVGGGDGAVQEVGMRDVVSFAALVLERPEEFLAKRVELASEELTGAEVARALSRVVGRQFAAERVRCKSLPDGVARLFVWLEQIGDHVGIAPLPARYRGVGWLSFERWAARQDWSKLKRLDGRQ